MRHYLLLTAVAALSVLCRGPALADERLGSTPQEGVLILRNGEAVGGRISLIGEQYCVSQNGAEIRIKAADADYFCQDLDEAYEIRRRRVEPGKVMDRIALSEWCLRHGMTGNAATELAEAIAIEPRHPRIPLLERRLRLAVSPPSAPAEPVRTRTGPSNEELDRLVRSLPQGAVENFANTIQPLLLNHCATAGCHGASAKDELRLGKSQAGQPITRRMTQRNLAVVLRLLDNDQPEQSPLLEMARKQHGTAKSAPLTDHDAASLRQLTYWVHKVAAPQAAAVPARIGEVKPLLQRQEQAKTAAAPDETAADEKSELPDDSPDEGLESAESGAESGEAAPEKPDSAGRRERRPRKPPQRGRGAEAFTPADPFDPEIFNRRFHPDGAEKAGRDE